MCLVWRRSAAGETSAQRALRKRKKPRVTVYRRVPVDLPIHHWEPAVNRQPWLPPGTLRASFPTAFALDAQSIKSPSAQGTQRPSPEATSPKRPRPKARKVRSVRGSKRPRPEAHEAPSARGSKRSRSKAPEGRKAQCPKLSNKLHKARST